MSAREKLDREHEAAWRFFKRYGLEEPDTSDPVSGTPKERGVTCECGVFLRTFNEFDAHKCWWTREQQEKL